MKPVTEATVFYWKPLYCKPICTISHLLSCLLFLLDHVNAKDDGKLSGINLFLCELVFGKSLFM